MFGQNRLKAHLSAGKVAYGCWIGGGSVQNAEILGHAGFDFLLTDHEHGIGETRELVDMLRAIETTPTPALLRVPWNDHVFLKRVLDAGVQSIMIPQVETAEEAEAAVQACNYPPRGIRGYAAGVVRASTFGNEPGYAAKANDEILVIVQLESEKAIRNAAAVAAVPGIDVVFIGINDLAGSMGLLEQTGHPDVQALAKEAEAAISAAGKVAGTVPNDGADVAALLDRGYRLIAGPHDVALLRDAGKAAMADYRKIQAARESGVKPATSGPTRSY